MVSFRAFETEHDRCTKYVTARVAHMGRCQRRIKDRKSVCADYDVVGFHMPETMWLPHAQSSVLIIVLARDKARRARSHVE